MAMTAFFLAWYPFARDSIYLPPAQSWLDREGTQGERDVNLSNFRIGPA